MIYLTKQDLIDLNRYMYEEYGGNYTPPFNLHNEATLDYVVEFIQNDLYYPTIHDKASLLIFNLSEGHTFADGNKRTATFSCIQFLELNFYKLKDSVSNHDLITLTLDIASSRYTRDEIIHWLILNTEDC